MELVSSLVNLSVRQRQQESIKTDVMELGPESVG